MATTRRWQKRISRSLKLRFAVLYPFGTWAVLTRYSTDASIMRGIWWMLAGLFIRSWANGYAIKTEQLTTCGPYAYVRHPLYLGSFLIVIGFLVILEISWIAGILFLSTVIGIVYFFTVKDEERLLLQKFPQDYADYRRLIPSFLPVSSPYKKGAHWKWSLKRYIKSQEYKLVIWMVVMVIFFHLKEEFLVEGESFDSKSIFLLVAALCLGLFDAAGEFMKKRARRKDALCS